MPQSVQPTPSCRSHNKGQGSSRFTGDRAAELGRPRTRTRAQDAPSSRGEEMVSSRLASPAMNPPSTTRVVPVIQQASSEARNAMAEAMSYGWPIRPSGYQRAAFSRTCGSAATLLSHRMLSLLPPSLQVPCMVRPPQSATHGTGGAAVLRSLGVCPADVRTALCPLPLHPPLPPHIGQRKLPAVRPVTR